MPTVANFVRCSSGHTPDRIFCCSNEQKLITRRTSRDHISSFWNLYVGATCRPQFALGGQESRSMLLQGRAIHRTLRPATPWESPMESAKAESPVKYCASEKTTKNTRTSSRRLSCRGKEKQKTHASCLAGRHRLRVLPCIPSHTFVFFLDFAKGPRARAEGPSLEREREREREKLPPAVRVGRWGSACRSEFFPVFFILPLGWYFSLFPKNAFEKYPRSKLRLLKRIFRRGDNFALKPGP